MHIFAHGKTGFELQKSMQVNKICYSRAFKIAGILIHYFKWTGHRMQTRCILVYVGHWSLCRSVCVRENVFIILIAFLHSACFQKSLKESIMLFIDI